MRIFVLGTGATGSYLAHLLTLQGHQVTCGDRDLDRARRFLGKKSTIPVVQVNARNLWGIVRAARGSQLLVNASAAVFNEIVLRAALRIRCHYMDLSAHLTRNPFKAEQLRYDKRFQQKNRCAVITAGAAPGLTNLLVARAAALIDSVNEVHIRLYESTESDDPVSQWSAEVSFDEAISLPRVVRDGRFRFGKRFGEREKFRFPAPIGEVNVVLAAQDEVGTVPYFLKLKEMDVKIGGNEIDRLRRWYRQGKLSKSRGLVASRFPKTPSPRQVARLIRRGKLQNARFAAAVILRGMKQDQPLEVRYDALFPSLYQIRQRGLALSPVSYATAQLAALFVRNFPRDSAGVFPPGAIPLESRQAIFRDLKSRDIRVTMKITKKKPPDDEEDF
ncbi:MAG TPA: saccharopine dehydrogenase NADP-binding domain-containing protein [Candidatus Acidoferrum sp.]|jgi:saccharopine dehydrogenase (NAD+, L-lysine-forming)|nr:saccharopine dehydrogenase NADP-binding domain-containing protein [Candidatus Acidoferrum sp.]